MENVLVYSSCTVEKKNQGHIQVHLNKLDCREKKVNFFL